VKKEAHAQRKKTKQKYSEKNINKNTIDINITQMMMMGKQVCWNPYVWLRNFQFCKWLWNHPWNFLFQNLSNTALHDAVQI